MARVTSYGTKGSEAGAIIKSRAFRPGLRPAVIFCHGWKGVAWNTVNFPDPVIDLLADSGYPVSSHDLGGAETWGNDAAQAAISAAISYMQASEGAKSGKVLLYAGSMGTLAALNYARANPSAVAAVACVLPAVDLADLHDNSPARSSNNTAIPASIEAAYGGAAAYTAARAAHSPAESAAPTVPAKLWYSSDDVTVLPATVTSYAAAKGVPAASFGAAQHTITGLPASDVAAFLTAVA